MIKFEAGEERHSYRIFYPSGLQFHLEGRLDTVRMEGSLYPVVLLASDEIMILDPRAVVANVGTRSIDYSPRYHSQESFSRHFQTWLAEWPSWGTPGSVPLEGREEAG